MSRSEVEPYSLAITRKLYAAVSWQNVNSVCLYSPIAVLNEVDISKLAEALAYKYPGMKIRVLGTSKTQAIPRKEFDIIVVPCLAFDDKNYRLGWGGGFYDKFLALQPQAQKIGVCFRNGYAANGLPHQQHDIPLDKVITQV